MPCKEVFNIIICALVKFVIEIIDLQCVTLYILKVIEFNNRETLSRLNSNTY